MLLVSPNLVWWFAFQWPAFMALIPEAQVNQFSGLFTFIRTFAAVWHSGPIYVALATGLSSANTGRQVGVLTMLVWG